MKIFDLLIGHIRKQVCDHDYILYGKFFVHTPGVQSNFFLQCTKCNNIIFPRSFKIDAVDERLNPNKKKVVNKAVETFITAINDGGFNDEKKPKKCNE